METVEFCPECLYPLLDATNQCRRCAASASIGKVSYAAKILFMGFIITFCAVLGTVFYML